ncbi:hypothetical protein CHS0354_005687 [Potamilus streckersoni]|uniref:Decapping nuclease n=1 Tax=Potamilus streckersoni TaxID=2493646 RepID=A0AAE0S407_9BIVA|nr:hypothetical protein CHS0354_005687 [Potamilus streckersoni]
MQIDNTNTEMIPNKKVKYSSEFSVQPIRRFDAKFPPYRRPIEIGAFSQDSSRAFQNGRGQLKFYIKPKKSNSVNFDLKRGYNEMIRKDEAKKIYIDDVLRWIMKNEDKFALNQVKPQRQTAHKSRELNTDFICWRGLLTKFLCTPYENKEGWLVSVTKFNNTFYLCEFDTEDKKKQRESMTPRQDEMCCWGWKFEQYLTSDKPDGVPDVESPVNNNEAFATVVRTRLNSHSLVFAGEVDAIDPSLTTSNKYVEFKTSREIDNQRQDNNMKRFKLIKWWAQSFLVGIPKIVCGFRDDDGIVHRLQTYDTLEIPDLVKNIYNPWNPAVCFNFLDELLSFIKESVIEDNAKVAYLFQWHPGQKVVCEKLHENSEYTFLPAWFTDPPEDNE